MNKSILYSTVDSSFSSNITSIAQIYGIELSDNYKDILIEDMRFSERTYQRLKQIQCATALDLLKCSNKMLFRITGFGIKCYNEVISKIMDLKKDTTNHIILLDNVQIKHGPVYVRPDLGIALELLLQGNQVDTLHSSLTQDEQTIYNRFIAAIDDLGVEICKVAYFTPEKVQSITLALDDYCTKYVTIRCREKVLLNLFKDINPKLTRSPLYPLVMAFSGIHEQREFILDCFHSTKYVWQIQNCFEMIAKDPKIYKSLLPFLDFLKYSSQSLFDDKMAGIFKKDNHQQILACRAQGGTLEDAAKILGVSREGARQIEKNVQYAFDRANRHQRPIWLLCAELGGKLIIEEDVLFNEADCKSKILWYLLCNSSSKYYTYNKDLRVFLLCDDASEAIQQAIDILPDHISIKDAEAILDNISNTVNFPIELVHRLFDKQFSQNGTFYAKKRISLTSMYNYVLRQFYPHGVKLFDELEIEQFKSYITKTFGDVKFPPTNRAIDARVANIAVLCNRGAYIHECYVNIPDKMIEKINDYINNSPRIAFSFLELFEIFKDELLLCSNISNRYFLQGVLKLKLGNKYRFNRDYISKSAERSIDQEIVDFIVRRGEVSKVEIRSAFSGVSEAMLFQIIMRCPEIICIDSNLYMHDTLLNIEELDYSMSDFISKHIVNMPISSRKLFEYMSGSYSDFIFRNDINTHSKLFGILKYMFGSEYRFSRPYIARKEAGDISTIAIIKDYLKDFNIVVISELVDYCAEHHLRYLSFEGLAKELDDIFLRKDVNSLINISLLDLSDEKLETIHKLLIDDITAKGFLSAAKIDTFIYYPDIGSSWNGWLAMSLVKKFFDDIPVLEYQTSNNETLNAIFLHPSFELESYEEFIKWLVKSEHVRSPFQDLDEIKNWLMDEGLINIKLPNFLDGYVYKDQYSKIIVG